LTMYGLTECITNKQTSATLVLLQDYLLNLPHEKLKTECSGVSERVSGGKLMKFAEYM